MKSPSVVEEAEKRRKRGIVKCRAYRFRLKAEFDELRNQDTKLNQELSRLRKIRKEEKINRDATQTSAYLLWRDLAVRLGVERKHSEAQRKQLRFLVDNQDMYIGILREILSKKSCGLIPSIDCNEYGCNVNKYLPSALLDRYMQELEARFLQTDDVFNGLDPSSLYNVQHVVKQGSYGVVKHFYPKSKVVLPFSLSETASTMWKLGHRYFSDKERFLFHGVNDTANSFATSFVDTNVLETGEEFKRVQRLIARQFVQDDQIVIVWKVIFIGDGLLRGVRADETGWCRLKPSGDKWEPGTVIEMCAHRGLTGFDSSAPVESTITEFLDVLKENSRGILADLVDSLESILLEEHAN
ncbi:hypothetical protein PHMEG_00028157 [Phytophthora megakarya]|uniref:M96 mating-specific protein n=1 Tax=Phytophthora megakarya TaxID=4795 RepID=A0A225V569_9STRA|nr:hypothetical protein PHMEG_00028157 [Phytophthora megakarya]